MRYPQHENGAFAFCLSAHALSFVRLVHPLSPRPYIIWSPRAVFKRTPPPRRPLPFATYVSVRQKRASSPSRGPAFSSARGELECFGRFKIKTPKRARLNVSGFCSRALIIFKSNRSPSSTQEDEGDHAIRSITPCISISLLFPRLILRAADPATLKPFEATSTTRGLKSRKSQCAISGSIAPIHIYKADCPG